MIEWPDIKKRRRSTEPWSERSVQDAVYIHCAIKNHEIIVPNSCMFAWESDVVSVTRSGFTHEFEIKITRSDFKQDAKKERTRLLLDPTVTGYFHSHTVSRPNYFWYVTPEGMIAEAEVPDYAGLIYAMEPVVGYHLYFNTTKEIKPAQRIHREKITDAARQQLARSMTVRYWKQRLRETEASPKLSLGIQNEESHRQAFFTK